MDLVGAKIASKWRLFGIALKIPLDELDTYTDEKPIERIARVFDSWVRNGSPEVSWTTVIEKLELSLLREKTLASTLREMFSDQLPPKLKPHSTMEPLPENDYDDVYEYDYVEHQKIPQRSRPVSNLRGVSNESAVVNSTGDNDTKRPPATVAGKYCAEPSLSLLPKSPDLQTYLPTTEVMVSPGSPSRQPSKVTTYPVSLALHTDMSDNPSYKSVDTLSSYSHNTKLIERIQPYMYNTSIQM